MGHWSEAIGSFWSTGQLPLLLILGVMVLTAYFGSLPFKRIGLPVVLAYMLIGILLGPSVSGILNEGLLSDMDFVIQGCLAFIAFKIGLEIDLKEVKEQGKGLAITTITESLLAVILVCAGVWALSGELALGLAMGALSPASAPAGTIAVIEEYKAKGKLTETLYSVVGIDDGLGILLFGIVTPFAILVLGDGGMGTGGATGIFLHSLEEIALSIVLGAVFAWLFILVNKERMDNFRVVLLTFGFILLLAGIGQWSGASVILSNMIFGLGVGNRGSGRLHDLEEADLGVILPFFFLLFFTIAGANLHIAKLSEAGVLALVYIVCRSLGLYGGAFVGTTLGGFDPSVRKNLGLGILSQAGVAIGLALIVEQKFAGVGPMVAEGVSLGDRIGDTIFTTITATSVFFESIGPLLAKYGLKRAGEIGEVDAGGP